MPADLDAIQARLDQTLWRGSEDQLIRCYVDSRGLGMEDLEFFAHTPEDVAALVAELRAARECVARVRAHVLNDEIYCARCMEDLVAYEKAAGLPVTVPEATRAHTGEIADASR